MKLATPSSKEPRRRGKNKEKNRRTPRDKFNVKGSPEKGKIKGIRDYFIGTQLGPHLYNTIQTLGSAEQSLSGALQLENSLGEQLEEGRGVDIRGAPELGLQSAKSSNTVDKDKQQDFGGLKEPL